MLDAVPVRFALRRLVCWRFEVAPRPPTSRHAGSRVPSGWASCLPASARLGGRVYSVSSTVIVQHAISLPVTSSTDSRFMFSTAAPVSMFHRLPRR